MFTALVDAMSGAWWTYLLVFGVCLGDAVVPLLPSETMVVTGGVLSASHRLALPLVIVTGAVGAFCGDSLCWWLGRRFGPAAQRRLFRGPRGKRSLDWAKRQLHERGRTIVVVARFVPGGRTATTFTAGLVEMPFRTRFGPAAAVGAVVWGGYNAGIGFVGGKAFEDEPWKGLVLAFGLAMVSAVAIELVRKAVARRRGRRDEGADAPEPEPSARVGP